MGYKESLSSMVTKSGLTLREIADRCREKGVTIDPSYISKLQTGKQPSASEEVSRAIAEVCGENPDHLVFEGYMDKAPDIIRKTVDKMAEITRETLLYFFSNLYREDTLEISKERLEKMSPYEFLKIVADEGLIMPFETMSVSKIEKEDLKILVNPLFGIPVLDAGMAPLIPKHSLVNIDQSGEYQDDDIVLAYLSETKYIVRRLMYYENKVILIPVNPLYQKDIYDKSEVRIAGRINSIITYMQRKEGL